jgi:hypothetical protein
MNDMTVEALDVLLGLSKPEGHGMEGLGIPAHTRFTVKDDRWTVTRHVEEQADGSTRIYHVVYTPARVVSEDCNLQEAVAHVNELDRAAVAEEAPDPYFYKGQDLTEYLGRGGAEFIKPFAAVAGRDATEAIDLARESTSGGADVHVAMAEAIYPDAHATDFPRSWSRKTDHDLVTEAVATVDRFAVRSILDRAKGVTCTCHTLACGLCQRWTRSGLYAAVIARCNYIRTQAREINALTATVTS